MFRSWFILFSEFHFPKFHVESPLIWNFVLSTKISQISAYSRIDQSKCNYDPSRSIICLQCWAHRLRQNSDFHWITTEIQKKLRTTPNGNKLKIEWRWRPAIKYSLGHIFHKTYLNLSDTLLRPPLLTAQARSFSDALKFQLTLPLPAKKKVKLTKLKVESWKIPIKAIKCELTVKSKQ